MSPLVALPVSYQHGHLPQRQFANANDRLAVLAESLNSGDLDMMKTHAILLGGALGAMTFALPATAATTR
jgi:hypothetical protein